MNNWYRISQHLQNVEMLDLDERSVTRAIRDAIISEEGAINQYETIVDSTDNDHVKEVLQSISDEEKVHVGELIQLLADIIGEAEDVFLDDGRKEVKGDG